MRAMYNIVLVILCVPDASGVILNGKERAILGRAEAAERELLGREDMLMVNHLRSQGVFVDTSNAFKHMD